MQNAYIIIGTGALNIILENELYNRLKGPFYVLLSHKSEAIEEQANKLMQYGGQIVFLVDSEMPYRQLTKRQQEQLVYLYEEELKAIANQCESFIVIGGAAGPFSGNVLEFYLKLLIKKQKRIQLITWLATSFEGRKWNGQVEQILQLINRQNIDATVIQPHLEEGPFLAYLEKLNEQIAHKILERCSQ